jgi:hypothetical protein
MPGTSGGAHWRVVEDADRRFHGKLRASKEELQPRLMLLSVPIPGTEGALDRNDVAIQANQGAHVPDDGFVSGYKLQLLDTTQVPVDLVLKLPKLWLITVLVVSPGFDGIRVGKNIGNCKGWDAQHRIRSPEMSPRFRRRRRQAHFLGRK